MDFKEFLYDYISANAYPALNGDEKYQRANASKNAAEERLSATLTEEQRRLLDEFTGCLLMLCDAEAYYIFCEALRLLHTL